MKLILFWKPAAWLLLVCYGLLSPADNLPVKPFLNIPYFDKIVHFALFFIMCLLLFRPFKRLGMNHRIWAPAVTLALAALLEGIQQTVSASRSSSYADFIANITGIGAAFLVYSWLISGRKLERIF